VSARQPGLVWKGPDSYVVEETDVPQPPPDWIAIDVAYAGICGSDLHIAAGEHPRARPGVVLGHEFVGRLAEAVGELPAGAPVFANPMVTCGACDACIRGLTNVCQRLTAVGVDYPGAIAPTVHVPAANIFALPTSADLRRYALVEPMAVCVRAIRRGGVAPGTRVRVVGAGPIGVLLGLLCQHHGADVDIVEPSAWRREQADTLGLVAVEQRPPDHWADVVFDAAGHPAVPPQLSGWARPQGAAVMVAAYKPGTHPVDLLAVNFAELTLIGTRIYDAEDISAAIALLGSTDAFDSVITRTLPLDQAGEAVDALKRGAGLKILIRVAT
jgi:(R,R)-butanediol dehydrogenase/meso-butanediol dehydrogenase/diacetyl reductase